MAKDRSAALSKKILRHLQERSKHPLKPKEIARALKIPTERYRELRSLLRKMAARGEIYRVKRGRYAPPDKISVVIGRFTAARQGGGKVTGDPPDSELLFVPPARIASALHGDRVACRVMKRRSGPLPEGEIIRVIERARTSIVGTISVSAHIIVVEPEDPNITRGIVIPRDELAGAEDGQMVSVEIVSWGDRRKMMVGRVTEILGTPGDPNLDMLIVMKDFGLPVRFPEAVEDAAERLPDSPVVTQLKGRKDIRDTICFTIDPVDARDFDDALSIQTRDDGDIEVGIHIADVSHYVTPGGLIDREAFERGTSVYLVDRVVPMLPEKISNRLCSLVPDEDRFAFTTIIRLTEGTKIRSARFFPSVIRSHRRFTYQEVQTLLDGKSPAKRDQEFLEPLRSLRDLSERLWDRRISRGGLDFDLPASHVVLDDNGLPIDIQRVIRLPAHRLVETFMILANEAVAKRLKSVGWPALYRAHEAPDPMATAELAQNLARIGLQLPVHKGKEITPRVMQKILTQVEGQPEAELVNTLVLRAMKRARYDPSPIGHFGLAMRNYTHFTSPIRRYPDLIVHRVLKEILSSGEPPVEEDDDMARIGEHCSERERVAEEAERASVELKKVQFMAERIGERYEGRIVSVTAFGFFVELDTYHVQGLVHVNRLDDDYYVFREEHRSLTGEHTGRAFRLGDVLEVEVARADIARRQIDFELVT